MATVTVTALVIIFAFVLESFATSKTTESSINPCHFKYPEAEAISAQLRLLTEMYMGYSGLYSETVLAFRDGLKSSECEPKHFFGISSNIRVVMAKSWKVALEADEIDDLFVEELKRSVFDVAAQVQSSTFENRYLEVYKLEPLALLESFEVGLRRIKTSFDSRRRIVTANFQQIQTNLTKVLDKLENISRQTSGAQLPVSSEGSVSVIKMASTEEPISATNTGFNQSVTFNLGSAIVCRGNVPELSTNPEVLRQLINASYVSAKTNLKALLEYVQRLPLAFLEVTGYEAIFEAMSARHEVAHSSEIFMLASYISDLEKNSSKYNKVEGQWRQRLETLKSRMPAVVQAIAFGGPKCTLRNKKFGRYLYAAEDGFKSDNQTRRVFLQNPGRGPILLSQEWWNFGTSDRGESWFIRNLHFGGEYLHAIPGSEGQADKERRRTGTSKNLEASGAWKLAPILDGKFISMTNVETSELIYGAVRDLDDNEKRQTVYTWIPKPHYAEKDDQAQWAVSCSKLELQDVGSWTSQI